MSFVFSNALHTMNDSAVRIGEIIGNVDSASIVRSLEEPSRIILTIDGWLIHSVEKITDLYFEAPDAVKVRHETTARPDLQLQFPHLSHISHAGYRVTFEFPHATLVTPLSVKLFATLESGFLIQTQVEIPIQLPSDEQPLPAPQQSSDLATIALRTFLESSARLTFPSARTPKLSIIIVTFNRAAETLACLQALAIQADTRSEIILIDNASSDLTKKLLKKVDGITIIENSTNEHFLRGANQGALLAKGELVLFLNNDTQVMPGGLAAIFESFDDHPNLGVLGARLVHPSGKLQEVGSHLLPDGSAVGIGVGEHVQGLPFLFQRTVDFCSGAFLVTPHKVWKSLGGFDLTFAPAYYEDADYCLRVHTLGLEVLIEPRIVVIHNEGAIGENSLEARSLMTINREKLFLKHQHFFSNHASQANAAIKIIPPMEADPKRVLLIDDFFPSETTGQGAPRSKVLVEALLSQGSRVTFVALNDLLPDIINHCSGRLEMVTLKGRSGLLEYLAVRGGSFGTMIISRPHNMEEFLKIRERHPVCAKNCLIIYDAEAIFALREIRQREVREQKKYTDNEIEQIVSVEILAVQRAHQIWVTSQTEKEEFYRRGVEKTHVVSYGVTEAPSATAFHERSNLLFLGPLTDAASPNGDGFYWFMNHIFPHIHLNSLRVTHVGNNTSGIQFPSALVDFQGPQVNLSSYFECSRIFIAPIRFGAGIPLKVIEAAARGLPIVTTRYIAQQLNWKEGEQLLVGHDAADFRHKIEQLYSNQNLWEALRQKALESVQREYSLKNFEVSLFERLSFR